MPLMPAYRAVLGGRGLTSPCGRAARAAEGG